MGPVEGYLSKLLIRARNWIQVELGITFREDQLKNGGFKARIRLHFQIALKSIRSVNKFLSFIHLYYIIKGKNYL